MPPIRPSYALARSRSGNTTGVPATNRTSLASTIALPVSGMELLQSFAEGATLDGPRFLARAFFPLPCLAAACLATRLPVPAASAEVFAGPPYVPA